MNEDQSRTKTGKITAKKKITNEIPRVSYFQLPRSITRGR